MGDGISCQGATFNFTPYVTGNLSQQHPYEPIYQDPVYNNVDADDDGVPDNPTKFSTMFLLVQVRRTILMCQ